MIPVWRLWKERAKEGGLGEELSCSTIQIKVWQGQWGVFKAKLPEGGFSHLARTGLPWFFMCSVIGWVQPGSEPQCKAGQPLSVSQPYSVQQEIWMVYFHRLGSSGSEKPSESFHGFTFPHSGSHSFPRNALSSQKRSGKAVNSNDILVNKLKGSIPSPPFQFNSCKAWNSFRKSFKESLIWGGLCLFLKSPQIIWCSSLQNVVCNSFPPEHGLCLDLIFSSRMWKK